MSDFAETTPPEELAAALAVRPLDLPDGWWNWENAMMAHRLLARDCLANIEPFPANRFSGRGIVICAGGERLFTNAWVCLKNLRRRGCGLPVELWHLDGEVDDYMEGLVAPDQARCINASDIARRLPRQPRILNGWELKAFAMLHCRFGEVLLLDADNVPVVDPEFLFETHEYRSTGAIFWPDFGRMEATRGVWRAAEVAYRDEPEFESGQIVVDKARCWRALSLAMHYNEHSDFYYEHIHGDKCTFRFAWHRTATTFAMPPFPIHPLYATMCQHDFSGRRIFQHRNMDKWDLNGSNMRIKGFMHEDDCREFLGELRSRWNGAPYAMTTTTVESDHLRALLADRAFLYRRVGYDERRIVLNSDGSVGEGAASCERRWSVTGNNHGLALTVSGDFGPILQASLTSDGIWRGRWLKFERMPIELIPDSSLSTTDAPRLA